METLDLKKQYKFLYQPSAKQVERVDVPELGFAEIAGRIQPGETPGSSPAFQEAVGALYSLSYTLKFMVKKRPENPIDYPVMPLEALWWVEDGHFDITQPGNWHWQAMIMQPEPVTADLFAEALRQVMKKKPGPANERLRYNRFQEGLSLQVMHIGPYSAEPETIARMNAYAQENGLRPRGRHHEIYLSDPTKGDPAKLKTILRQPVVKIDQAVEVR